MSQNCFHEHKTHNHKEQDRGIEFSLYKFIDTTKTNCINEKEKNSVLNCFKPWNERLDTTKFLESNIDEELILYIPFTSTIKLKSIMIIGGENGQSPKKMKIFINRNDIDFSNISIVKPIQEWDLQEDFKGEFEYPTKITKFNNVSNITIYFHDTFGAENTKIYYIGLKGDVGNLIKREAIITVYEAKPQISDHKISDKSFLSKQIE